MVIGLQNIVRNFKRMIPKVVFVLGGPGAGKGTQCKRIFENFGYKHLSAGDLLREERADPDSEYGELIENHIKEGKIVPVDITCSLLEKAMVKASCDKFLIDGFPRNKDNLDGWNKRVAEKVCIDRCLNRGASGSGRSDDNVESLKKRINTYISETKPIIEYYDERNLVKCVNANMSEADVFDEVRKIFNEAEMRNYQ